MLQKKLHSRYTYSGRQYFYKNSRFAVCTPDKGLKVYVYKVGLTWTRLKQVGLTVGLDSCNAVISAFESNIHDEGKGAI